MFLSSCLMLLPSLPQRVLLRLRVPLVSQLRPRTLSASGRDLGDAVDEMDRMAQQVAADGENGARRRDRQTVAGDLQRRLQHRQGEPLTP